MKTWRYSEFTFKCSNGTECGMEWTTINRHDIYCGYCRSFGAIIREVKKEEDSEGNIKIIE